MKKKLAITGSSTFILVILITITFMMNISGAQDRVYRIGERGPAGGWIFYDKGNRSDGWRYLEAASEDQGTARWGCYGKFRIPGAHGITIGTGKSNTQAILKSCGESNIAARKCTAYRGGGKDDWFLPSKEELQAMYKNLHKSGVGRFSTDYYYWSSTEDIATAAWYNCFNDGSSDYIPKNSSLRIRAIRSF